MLQCHAPPPAHPFIIYIFKQHKPHLHKYRIRGSVSNEPTVTKVYSSATYPAPHKNAARAHLIRRGYTICQCQQNDANF